jgi:guanylate kinase
LKKRLKNRNTESERDIEKRLKTAEEELKYQCYYDCIIVNNDYNEALLNLKQVLLLQKEAV